MSVQTLTGLKQPGWKPFAIGVLLATTVMLGTGAISRGDKWIYLAFQSPNNDEFVNKEFANKIN